MTRQEWDRIAAVLDNGFPGHFGEAESAAYWLLLGGRSARQVEQAVRRSVDNGLKYRPTPSELVRFMKREVSTLHSPAWVDRYVAMYGEKKGMEIASAMLGRELKGEVTRECHNELAAP